MKLRNSRLKEPPPAPRARKTHGRQRQRLIDACISALHLYGPSRTTVEKVVAIAKMSPGIVRFYFDSKAAMLVASLQFLAAEFEERLIVPVAALKDRPVAALELLVDLYLDADIASPRKVSVWYAFWGEASSRQEYYDICGQKDESFAALVRELIERLIADTARTHLDADGIALGLIGVLEILWQDFAFRGETDIDRAGAKRRCMAYLRSVFPGSFPAAARSGAPARRTAAPDGLPTWAYGSEHAFALERERVFRDAWVLAAHESDVAQAGDFFTLDTGSERVVLVRDGAGAIHALRNNCPDSPHAVVAGAGRFDGRIVCRLHGMEFALDGSGRHGRAGLHVLALAMVGGMIYVRSDGRVPSGMAVAAAPPPLHEDGRARGNDWLVRVRSPAVRPVNADWKVLVEHWLESVPAETLLPAEALQWAVTPWRGDGWSARRYRGMSRVHREWHRQFLPPNQLMEARPDGVSVLHALAVGAGRTVLRHVEFSAAAQDDSSRAVAYLAERLGGTVRDPALRLAESVQQGLLTFGYAAAPGRTRPPAVAWFHRYLAARAPALLGDRPPPVF